MEQQMTPDRAMVHVAKHCREIQKLMEDALNSGDQVAQECLKLKRENEALKKENAELRERLKGGGEGSAVATQTPTPPSTTPARAKAQ